MNILSFFTKAPEVAIETVRESAAAGFKLIDESFDTADEKREAKSEIIKIYAGLWESTTKETTGTSEARRWLLHRITNFVLNAALACIVLGIIGVLKPEWNDQCLLVVTIIKEIIIDWQIGWAFVAGVSFYYITHIAKAVGGGK